MNRALIGWAASIGGFGLVGYAASTDLQTFIIAMIGAVLIAASDMITGANWS